MGIVKPFSPALISWLILLLLSLIWGSSFILIKKSLVAFSPQQVAGLRISISALAFQPFLWFRFKQVPWKKWPFFLIVGLMGSAIPAFLFAFAQTQINSTLAGILNSLTPLFTLVVGMLFFKTTVGWKKVTGVFIGLLGALLLIGWSSGQTFSGQWIYALLIVLATLCYAVSLNTVATFLKGIESRTISAVSFSFMGIPAIVLLGFTNFTEVLQHHPDGWSSLAAVTILALFGTVLATIIFFYLVQLNNAVFASMIAYLIPIVALGWGVADGESIEWMHLLAMIFILAGIFIGRNQKTNTATSK